MPPYGRYVHGSAGWQRSSTSMLLMLNPHRSDPVLISRIRYTTASFVSSFARNQQFSARFPTLICVTLLFIIFSLSWQTSQYPEHSQSVCSFSMILFSSSTLEISKLIVMVAVPCLLVTHIHRCDVNISLSESLGNIHQKAGTVVAVDLDLRRIFLTTSGAVRPPCHSASISRSLSDSARWSILTQSVSGESLHLFPWSQSPRSHHPEPDYNTLKTALPHHRYLLQ